MGILDRISKLLGNREQRELTNHLGLKSVAFSEWKSGKSKSYRKYLIEIADFFNVSLDYLVYGKEKSSPTVELTADERELLDIYNRLSDKSKGIILGRAEQLIEFEAPVADEPVAEEPKVIMIRFIQLSASAGTGEPLPEDSRSTYLKIKHSDVAEEADYAVRINGDSMLPRFKDNDIVLVKAQEQVDEGNIGIFTVDGSGYIKEYAKDRLISINPDYEDIYFREGQELDCQGLVIATLEKEDFV